MYLQKPGRKAHSRCWQDSGWETEKPSADIGQKIIAEYAKAHPKRSITLQQTAAKNYKPQWSRGIF